MSEKINLQYSQLETGYEFPLSRYKLDNATVSLFLKATGDTHSYNNLVPPMAIAARAMAALSENISFPPGTIHVSQEFEFLDTVEVDEPLVSHASVSQKTGRGRFQIIAIDLSVFRQGIIKILSGRTSFILPEQNTK